MDMTNQVYTDLENKGQVKDPIVEQVVELYRERSRVGLDKYEVTLERGDLTTLEWLNHLQEELMDAVNYIEVLKRKFKQ